MKIVLRPVAFLTKVVLFMAVMNGQARAMGDSSLRADASIGIPSIKIENPDGTEAGYSGLSVQGRLVFPLFGDGIKTAFFGGIRYHDLENKSNSTTKELANHMGPAAGFLFQFGKVQVDLEYAYMKARHYLVGPYSRDFEFDYTSLNYSIGFYKSFNKLGVGISYAGGTGDIKSSETGLSKNSPVSEQSVWLSFTYTLDASFGQVASDLVR